MPSVLTRYILFLSSFSPLLGIYSLLVAGRSPFVAIAFVLIAGVAIIGLFLFLRQAAGLASHRITLEQSASRDSDIMGYVVTYLIPFLQIPLTDSYTVMALIVFLGVIAVVYVRSNMIYINPILSIAGYHITEIRSAEGRINILISKRSYIRAGTDIYVVSLGDSILLEKQGGRGFNNDC